MVIFELPYLDQLTPSWLEGFFASQASDLAIAITAIDGASPAGRPASATEQYSSRFSSDNDSHKAFLPSPCASSCAFSAASVASTAALRSCNTCAGTVRSAKGTYQSGTDREEHSEWR